jgi:hypothetical protein
MRHKITRVSKTCTVILILFIQAGILFFHVPCARSALSNQAEKLIVGFEEAELSRAILRCYRRLPSGRWDGPVALTPEFNIDEYRSLAGFSVPPYAPENFIPLVWSDYDEGTVKLLKVPVLLNLHKTDK